MTQNKKQKNVIFILALLTAAAVTLLAAGFVRSERTEPDNPLQDTDFGGLNISDIRLNYDAASDEERNAFGEDTESSGEGETESPEQPEEKPPAEQPTEQKQPADQPPQTPEEQIPSPGPSLVISFETDDDGTATEETGAEEGGEAEQSSEDVSDEPQEDDEPEESDEPEEPDEPEEEENPDVRVVTDLGNKTVTTDQLTDDVFWFYADIENGSDDMYLTVYYTDPEGHQRIVPGGTAYSQEIRLGRNTFTLLLKQGGQTLGQLSYTVLYKAEIATEEKPEIGEHPPTIETNLDGNTEPVSNENFTLTVTATDYHGNPLQASNLSVELDGVRITRYTGSSTMEYPLWLSPPLEGDKATHHITVTAWDDEGNSLTRSYDLDYEFIDEGGVIGQASVVIDATSVGLGVLEMSYTGDILQGQPASYLLARCMEEYGYEMDYSGSLDKDFYLRSISRYNFAKYAEPDEDLMAFIRLDGLAETSPCDKSCLGEYDFTQGSGWMYCVNGYYPGVSLSNYYLNDGDTLYLRFTLAYGKDIGGYSSTGGGQGMLSRYCARWINGGHRLKHTFENGVCTICHALDSDHMHTYVFETVQEATCTESGLQHGVCACGAETDEPIEPLPHEFSDGRCTRCGAAEEIHEHVFTETLREEPTCTDDGRICRECACGERKEERLPALGHQYDESLRCIRCGETDPEHIPQPEESGGEGGDGE